MFSVAGVSMPSTDPFAPYAVASSASDRQTDWFQANKPAIDYAALAKQHGGRAMPQKPPNLDANWQPIPGQPDAPAQTLAQRVRAQYPGAYDDLSDQELEALIDKKFPGQNTDIVRTPPLDWSERFPPLPNQDTRHPSSAASSPVTGRPNRPEAPPVDIQWA